MSCILFDCTQFLTFNSSKTIKIDEIREIFLNYGFQTKINREIDSSKQQYFSHKMFDYWGNVYIFSKFAHNNRKKEIDEITDLSGHVMENSYFVHESGGERKIREWRYERFYHSLEKLCSLNKNKKHISKNLAGDLFKLYKKLYDSVETFDESDSFYLELQKLEQYLEKLFWNFSLFEEEETFDPFIGVPCYKFQHSEEVQEKIDSLSKKISEGSLSIHEEKIARKMLKKLQGL